ncbi:hypothetical protein CXF97_02675 [Pseudomonas sp. Choline-02u-1]|nr:hypothetical protein CXF97_02675 [Pseudomonas sp. Choline-02u-1]
MYSASEVGGAHNAAFASRLAPTLDLWRSRNPCGSEPAREEARNPTAKHQPRTRLRTATISGTSTLLM